MEKEISQKLSIVALLLSFFPAISYILPIFEISLTGGVQTVIAVANIICALTGFILSVICVKKKENRNVLNIISTVVSALWLILIVGFGVLAICLTFTK